MKFTIDGYPSAVANAQMKQAGIDTQIDTGGRKVDNLENMFIWALAQAFSTRISFALDEIDKGPP
ncbi:MAG: hypothetical protein Ct9H300mP21_07520 [Pseudomonadota bacterium]|nr:MAG: hypothetical protein Ct9H300mP21_07520 [Pseudomonadota bacterium]